MTHYTICAALTLYLHGSSAGLTDPFVSFWYSVVIYLPPIMLSLIVFHLFYSINNLF